MMRERWVWWLRPAPGTPLRLQKWQCVEDASGKLKLHKCKGPVRPGGGGRALSNLVPKYYGQGSEACTCDSGDYKLSLAGRRKKFFKKSKCWSRAGWGGRPGEPLPGRPRTFGLQCQVSF